MVVQIVFSLLLVVSMGKMQVGVMHMVGMIFASSSSGSIYMLLLVGGSVKG